MKIYLDTIGCRLNQSEIETYARQFLAAGHMLVSDPQEADLAIINTCAVTAAAASDSRKKIRQTARAGAKEIIVTGCWSSLHPKEAARLPAVQQVIPNLDKDQLVPELLHIPTEIFDLEPLARVPVPGARRRTRAFIKVQDGCNNRCTFCITTLARGDGRSRTIEQVLADVQGMLQGEGDHAYMVQEVVFTGVHLGSWGHDFSPPMRLHQLIRAILDHTQVPRLRLSSLEPWDLDTDFFDLWQDARLCRQLHLPLQSGCGTTLRRMARKTTPESFYNLVTAARSKIPGIAITTDMIVGFPGESEAEFQESLAYVGSLNLAGGHVFSYSARPGTAAARMPDQVPDAVRKDRNAQMRDLLAEATNRYQAGFLGQQLEVLWESATEINSGTWNLSGLTDNYLRVHAQARRHLWNCITPVRIVAVNESGVSGEILTSSTRL
jgi:threonylcarbamoyladenosine tRNA methylthiotransferase MtaB